MRNSILQMIEDQYARHESLVRFNEINKTVATQLAYLRALGFSNKQIIFMPDNVKAVLYILEFTTTTANDIKGLLDVRIRQLERLQPTDEGIALQISLNVSYLGKRYSIDPDGTVKVNE